MKSQTNPTKMKDYPIGTIFTDAQGVTLEVVKQHNTCDGCYYLDVLADKCVELSEDLMPCTRIFRSDSTSVIFRKVVTPCHFTQRNQVR